MVCYFSNMEFPVRIANAAPSGPFLVVVPVSVVNQWTEEIELHRFSQILQFLLQFFSLKFYCEIAAHLAAAPLHPVPRSVGPVLQEKGNPAAPMIQQLNKQRVLRKDVGSRRTASSTTSLHPGPNAVSARALRSPR